MTHQRYLRMVLFATLVFTLFMALNPRPPATPIDHFGDKFSHMVAFAVLGAMSHIAYPRLSLFLLWERLVLFGAAIEVFQNIPSLHRSCDWRDWLADMVAAGAALYITSRAQHRLAPMVY